MTVITVTPGHGRFVLELVVVLGLFDAIWEGIKFLFGLVADAATSVAAALAAVWRFIQPIFTNVWHAIRPIWDSVLKPFWAHVQGWFKQLRTWWERWAKPVNALMTKIHELERVFYNATFGPILDTISDLQKLLALLGLSHTVLGERIANVLHELTTKLQDTYSFITVPVNDVIRRIEGYILDVDGFLHSDLLLNSLFKNIGAVWSLWWNAGLGALTPEGRRNLKKFGTRFPYRKTGEDLVRFLKQRDGELALTLEDVRHIFAATARLDDPPGYEPGAPRIE